MKSIYSIKRTDLENYFIGLGEKADDLKVFDIEKYIYGLFKDWENEYEK